MVKIKSDELVVQEMRIVDVIPRSSRIALSRRLTNGISNNSSLAIKRHRQTRRVQGIRLDDDADDSRLRVQDAQTVLQNMRGPDITRLVLRDFDCLGRRVRFGIVNDLLGARVDAGDGRAGRAREPQRRAAVVVGRFGAHDEWLGDAEGQREFFNLFRLPV